MTTIPNGENTPPMPEVHHDAFQGRVVLVTGGLGFIGAALSARLRSVGADVHTVSRREPTGVRPANHWQTDLAESTAVETLVGALKPNYVFHLASHVMGAPDRKHVLPTFRNNLQTTV